LIRSSSRWITHPTRYVTHADSRCYAHTTLPYVHVGWVHTFTTLLFHGCGIPHVPHDLPTHTLRSRLHTVGYVTFTHHHTTHTVGWLTHVYTFTHIPHAHTLLPTFTRSFTTLIYYDTFGSTTGFTYYGYHVDFTVDLSGRKLCCVEALKAGQTDAYCSI